jgi:hypothetical protein
MHARVFLDDEADIEVRGLDIEANDPNEGESDNEEDDDNPHGVGN